MCIAHPGPPGPPRYPSPLEDAFPANGVFFAAGWRFLRDGSPLELVVDVDASARLAIEVERPAVPLSPGEVLRLRDCPENDCATYRVVIGEPDTTPPATPAVTAHTRLVDDPVGTGWLSCPDIDELELVIETSDDATAPDDLGFVAYIAPTEGELAQVTAPAVAFGYDRMGDGGAPRATIVLGESEGRERPGGPFLSPDPFCFAVAAYDRAGNLSARSTATCLDTTDESDPTALLVPSTGCACGTGGGGGGAAGALPVLVALVGVALRRTRGPRP